MHWCEVYSATPEDTASLGRIVAAELTLGDVVLLVGDLASGKTTFVKAVAAACGYPEPATSPTFTLANFYQAQKITVLHMDTYRLQDAAEFRDLGLSDFMPEAATLIEWGDLVANDFPEALRIEFSMPKRPAGSESARPGELSAGSAAQDERVIRFKAEAARWEPVIKRFAAATGSVEQVVV